MRRLLILVCLLALHSSTAPPAAAANRIALVIGNAAYSDAGRLANPANDARDVSAALKGLGFEVITGIDLTVEQFADTLANFSRRIGKAKVALFYYAGHGLQYQGQNYLLPIDARLRNEFSIKRNTFNAADIIEQMEAEADVNIVLLDACRNNPLADALKQTLKSRGRSASVGRGLARIQRGASETLLVYAAAPGEEAQDGKGRNSPFTTAFLKHIATPGVEVEVLLKRVTKDVRAATQERQRPERLSRLTVEFYFSNGEAAKVTAEFGSGSGAAATRTESPPATPARSEAAEAWTVIRETEDQDVLKSFMARYGETFYGTLAKTRLEKLGRKQAAVDAAGPARLTGNYTARGTNPNGSKYTGKVRIWTESKTYKMRWDIAGSVFHGQGTLAGDTLTIDWGQTYPVIYKVGKNGVLHGTWGKGGKGKETLQPQ